MEKLLTKLGRMLHQILREHTLESTLCAWGTHIFILFTYVYNYIVHNILYSVRRGILVIFFKQNRQFRMETIHETALAS